MARFDLTDLEWSVIEPVLPTDVRGAHPADVDRAGGKRLQQRAAAGSTTHSMR